MGRRQPLKTWATKIIAIRSTAHQDYCSRRIRIVVLEESKLLRLKNQNYCDWRIRIIEIEESELLRLSTFSTHHLCWSQQQPHWPSQCLFPVQKMIYIARNGKPRQEQETRNTRENYITNRWRLELRKPASWSEPCCNGSSPGLDSIPSNHHPHLHQNHLRHHKCFPDTNCLTSQ